MRVSREKFAENRQKIIDAAGVMFREKGFDRVGVADIMKACGLTHGGFYGHFDSKEDLQLEASRALVARVKVRWRELIAESPDRPLEALVEHYVSWHAVDDPGNSCVFVSLMEEASRSTGTVREIFNDGLSALVSILAEIVSGDTPEERLRNGFTTLSTMMGAVSLARAVESRELAAQFLSTTREKLAPAAAPLKT